MGKTGLSKHSNQGTLGLDLFDTVTPESKVDNAFSKISSKGVKTLYMPSSAEVSETPDISKTPVTSESPLKGETALKTTPCQATSESEALQSQQSQQTAQAISVGGSNNESSGAQASQVSQTPQDSMGSQVSQTPQEYDPFEPLAARMRPRNIDEYIGQSHLLGSDKPLRKALERHRCQSMILWGPPGVGKTTLALMLAKATGAVLEQISAVVCGMPEIREAVARAKERRRHGVRTILFVDEVHRFNKLQQDAFLPHVEDGTIIFVGATTENPSFQVNSALLSRARVFVLKKLTEEELGQLLDLTLNSERGLKKERLVMDERVRKALIGLADGDARHLLTTLEMLVDDAAVLKDGSKQITYAMVGAIAGRRLLSYDKNGDAYYDLISAFHKSVRGSAPDAALYWYARILEAGGDPSYVARRILAIATEDVGLADPNAMQIALNAWDIFNRVGSAEGERAIAEAAVYMALAPKSNHLYEAFNQVRKDVVTLPSFDVPLYIRNAPTKLMSELGYHAGYRYAHDFPGAYAPGECFMPEELHGRRYYYPSERGFERYLKSKQEYLAQRDQMAEPAEQRFKPEHAQQMQTNLHHRYPELMANDLSAQADAEPQGLGPQISPQSLYYPPQTNVNQGVRGMGNMSNMGSMGNMETSTSANAPFSTMQGQGGRAPVNLAQGMGQNYYQGQSSDLGNGSLGAFDHRNIGATPQGAQAQASVYPSQQGQLGFYGQEQQGQGSQAYAQNPRQASQGNFGVPAQFNQGQGGFNQYQGQSTVSAQGEIRGNNPRFNSGYQSNNGQFMPNQGQQGKQGPWNQAPSQGMGSSSNGAQAQGEPMQGQGWQGRPMQAQNTWPQGQSQCSFANNPNQQWLSGQGFSSKSAPYQGPSNSNYGGQGNNGSNSNDGNDGGDVPF